MNTTAKGNSLEEKATAIIQEAINNGDLPLNPLFCKFFNKRKYFSLKREKEIIFDFALEIWPHNSKNFHSLYLGECKNYSHPVPVDDMEEFINKIQQISELNGLTFKLKGIFITNAGLQLGAEKLAKNYGIMVIQSNAKNYKVILHKEERENLLKNNLERQTDNKYIDKVIQTFLLQLFNEDKNDLTGFSYFSKNDIEGIANNVLEDFLNSEYKIKENLRTEEFRQYMYHKFDLRIFFCDEMKIGEKKEILGYFSTEENAIYILNNLPEKRLRFVLFHELGHFFLHRKLKINQEIYNDFTDSKFDFISGKHLLTNPKNWIEWQANQFAVSIILPKERLIVAIKNIQEYIGINKHFGAIYLDDQPVNKNDYFSIITHLSEYFKVSKTVVNFRLKSLGLINDQRKKLNPLRKWFGDSLLLKV